MTPKLNSELCEVLRQQGGGPLEVQDEQEQELYVIVPKQEYRHLIEHKFRQWLQVGLDQEARGEAIPWSVDEIRAEAHRRASARQTS